MVGRRSAQELKIPGSDLTIHAGKKIRKDQLDALKKSGVEAIELVDAEREGAFAVADVVDPSTGEVVLDANEELAERVIAMAQEKGVGEIEIFFPEKDEIGSVLSPRCARIRSAVTKRRSSRSTGASVRAIRPPSTARARSSKGCSSIPRSTTSRASAV
jgi:hypothetical protein